MKIIATDKTAEAKPAAEEKQKDANGKACWEGYRRHPTIKTGPGSCVPAKVKSRETSAMVIAIHAIVMGYNSVTASFIGADPEQEELLIGRGCVALTKGFSKFGVSAHVLPGLQAPSETGDAEPLYIIVGPAASIRKALDALSPGDSHSYYSSIIKLPV